MPADVELMRSLVRASACVALACTHEAPTEHARQVPVADTVRFVAQLGHGAAVEALAFSPDDRFVVSGGDQARVWDAMTGLVLRRLDLPSNAGDKVSSVQFAADRRVLLADTADSVAMFDIVTGERSRAVTLERRGSGHHFGRLAISPDGSRGAGELAFTDDDPHPTMLAIWDLADGKLVDALELGGPTALVGSIAFSADGRRIAARSTDGGVVRLRVWDVESRRVANDFALGGAWPVTKDVVAFSPDGTLLVAAEQLDGREVLGVWDLTTGASRYKLGNDGGHLEQVQFVGDRSVATLTVPSLGRESVSWVRTWDVDAGARVAQWPTTATAIGRPHDRARIATADATGLTIDDLATGEELRRFNAPKPPPSTMAAFSRDGHHLLVGGVQGLDLWNVDDLRFERALAADGMLAMHAALLDDRTAFGAFVDQEHMGIWFRWIDVASGREIRRRRADEVPLLSRDGRDLFRDTLAEDGKHHVLERVDAASLEVRGRFESDDPLYVGSTSPRGAIALLDPTHVTLWDASGIRRASFGEGRAGAIGVAEFAPDGERVLVGRYPRGDVLDHDLELWDASGRLVRAFGGKAGAADAQFVDATHALVGESDGTVTLWDVAAGTIAWSHHGHTSAMKVAVSADRRYAATASADGTVRLWRLDTGASVVLVHSGGWLVFSDDGYFDGSKDAGTLAAAIDGDRTYRIDQLATRSNRPDILLERMGLADRDTIEYFRARYQRRLQRAGLGATDEAARFRDAPRVAIVDAKQAGTRATLTVETANARSYNVWIDGVPLYGVAGKPVAAAHFTVDAELLGGANKIEVGVIGTNGLESLRALRELRVPLEAGIDARDLYYVGVGVSAYRDHDYDLAYASKDVVDLGEVMRHVSGFRTVHVLALTDRDATVAGLAKVKQFLAPATANDAVVLFFAGHGAHAPDRPTDYYFATYETDADDLAHTAASFDAIDDLLEGIAPRHKLLLLDACESGEAEVGAAAAPPPDGMRSRDLLRRARVTAPRPPRAAADRERYIFNDVIRRSGAIVISSSRGNEASYESPELHNGLFTAAILAAFARPDRADRDHDGSMSTTELAAWVSEQVAAWTQDRQHPTLDWDNRDIWLGFAADQ